MAGLNFVSFAATNFFRECYAVFVLAHGLIIFGANAAFTSVFIPGLKQESINISTIEESYLGSLSDLVTAIFILPATFFVIKFGRLQNLRIIFTLHAIGWLLMAVSPNITFMCISIIITSIGSSLVMPIVATYIVETCRVTRRGIYLSLELVFMPIGISLDLILNLFLSWKMVAAVMAAISASGFIQSLIIPETKYWYVLTNKPHLAESSMLWFERDLTDEDIRRQIENMQRSIASDANSRHAWRDLSKCCTQMDYAKPMLLGMILSVLRASNGRSLVATYSADAFSRLNTPYDSKLLSFWFGWLQCFGNLYYLFLTYCFNRKTMFYNIACIMIVCLILLIIANLYRGDDKNLIPMVPVALVFVYFATACTGFVSSIGVVVAEMQPARFRAEVLNLCTFLFIFTTFIVDFTYPILVTVIDFDLYFVSFLVVVAISLTIVYYLIPETSKKEFYDSQVYDTRL